MARISGRRRLSLAVLPLVLAFGLVTACGSSKSSSSSSGGGSGGAYTVKAAEYSWTAAKVENEILKQIAIQHPELGVKEIQTTALTPATAWAGAQRGDVDLIAEVALPNQQDLADKAKSKMSLVSQTYGGAKQGWFVPKYATEPGQPLAGLTSIDQLNQFKGPLKSQLVDDDPSYITSQQNKKRLQGYGVQFTQVNASEAAQLAQLKKAYDAKQPILVYLYHPHWVFSQFDMVQLKEPKPYTPGCLEATGKGDCAMPDYSASIAGSKNLQKKAPKFYAMLGKVNIPLDQVEDMITQVDVQKKNPTDVATQWVNSHKDQVNQWMQG
jgi:glycine betaine/proline transport system substrate-binding protein